MSLTPREFGSYIPSPLISIGHDWPLFLSVAFVITHFSHFLSVFLVASLLLNEIIHAHEHPEDLSSDFLPRWQYPPLLPSFPTESPWIFIFVRTEWFCRGDKPFSRSHARIQELFRSCVHCSVGLAVTTQSGDSAVQAASILCLDCFGLWLLPWHMAVEDHMENSTYSCPLNSLLARNTHTAFT